jgi:hypothetical protein
VARPERLLGAARLAPAGPPLRAFAATAACSRASPARPSLTARGGQEPLPGGDPIFVGDNCVVGHALIALTEKIHPLAIGNVQRQNNQSRVMARKLLLTLMTESEQHKIETLIDTLKSDLISSTAIRSTAKKLNVI